VPAQGVSPAIAARADSWSIVASGFATDCGDGRAVTPVPLLPVTISFFGQAFSEGQVLAYGYDFEQATKARVLPKHTPALPSDVLGMAAARKTP
jgi:amidase